MKTPATPAGLEYERNEQGGITITGYAGTAAELVIPAEIDGLPVTEIGESAFLGRRSLASVTIPAGVTSIGHWAFSGCTGLRSVTIPNSVTVIGDCAFIGCNSLKSVTVPNSVRTIGKYVLPGCGNANCHANKEARHG
jgi:hypothetical protein